MIKKIVFIVMTVILINVANAAPTKGKLMSNFKITSSALVANASIPSRYTCDADNFSPPLSWEGIPVGTKSLVLIVDDPDAPGGTWDHWVLYNIPVSVANLDENVQKLPPGVQVGENSWGKANYGGPCPPNGEHRYQFNLYALNATLDLPEGVKRSQLEKAMKGHIIQKIQLLTRYRRP